MTACSGCGNQTNDGASDQDSTQANEQQMTEAFITQRINDIYKDVYDTKRNEFKQLQTLDGIDKFDPVDFDAKYMSAAYNSLQEKAIKIGEDRNEPIIDADHWILGQDWTDPSMKVTSVRDITSTTATAHVLIHKQAGGQPSDEPLTLSLVWERGNWFIDNMKGGNENDSTAFDEKGWLENYVSDNAEY